MDIPRIAIPGLLLVGIWLAGTTGCSDSSGSGSGGSKGTTEETEAPAEEGIAVEVGRVTRGSLSALYSTSATLRADKQATVIARTQGVLKKLNVEEGDWVEEGQPLAVLDDDEQRIAFDQASATYETKRRAHERSKSLHEQGLMSDEDYETTRREAVEARHTAELTELTLSRTVIRATFAGRVLIRHLDTGASVTDGAAVYDLADLDPLYADVQVPERQVAELKPGQTVRLLTDDDVSSGEAEIERIAPAVDPSTGTVKVTLAVRRAGGLRPGSFVRLGIVTDTHTDTLLVPRSALVAEGRRWHLFRIKKNDGGQPVAELIEVTRGYEEREHVEILDDPDTERPLGQGDVIVVTGASSLSDGSNVEVMGDNAGETQELTDETVDTGVAA